MGLPTLREIRRAYKKTGLKPIFSSWFSTDYTEDGDGEVLTFACALGAVAVEKCSVDCALEARANYREETFVRECLGLSAKDQESFVAGFDATEFKSWLHNKSAYNRGARAREAFHSGLNADGRDFGPSNAACRSKALQISVAAKGERCSSLPCTTAVAVSVGEGFGWAIR